jgi:DNA-binding FrmR family transcriptional regulator
MDARTREQASARLRRIAGQVAGIQRMLDEERYCVDVLLQVAAARAALDHVGKLVLGEHVRTCVSQALESGRPKERRQKVEELIEVFSRFGALQAR